MANLLAASAALLFVSCGLCHKFPLGETLSHRHFQTASRKLLPYTVVDSGKPLGPDIPGVSLRNPVKETKWIPDLISNLETALPEGQEGGGISAAGGEKQPDLGTLGEVVEACRRALQFFRSHLTEMNLDAVIGTRIAEAQFKMVWSALSEKPKQRTTGLELPASSNVLGRMTAVQDVRALYGVAEELNSLAQPFIRSTRPEYYAELGGLLQPGFWEIPLSTKIFNTTAKPLANPLNVLNGVEQLGERLSDRCVSDTGRPDLDAQEERGKGPVTVRGKCSLGRGCWDLMTKPGYSGYSLTHQVFYLVIGLQAGCEDQLELFAKSTVRRGKRITVEKLLEERCHSILGEANAIAEADFPETRQDLFMEQGALCGILGYRDFFRKQWLAKVLSWQKPTGCFGDFRLFSASHKQSSRAYLNSRPKNNRVKREERAMGGYCLAHRTAVALGYLSLYVRFLATALFA